MIRRLLRSHGALESRRCRETSSFVVRHATIVTSRRPRLTPRARPLHWTHDLPRSSLNPRIQRPFSTTAATVEDDATTPLFVDFQNGALLQLGVPTFAQLASSAVVALAGSTTVTATVCHDHNHNFINSNSLLTVDVRFRSHGVGKLPLNRARSDFGVMSNEEILASRAVDRALRPLFRSNCSRSHVQVVVQSYDTTDTSGHPVAMSINAAAAVMYPSLQEPVAATSLCVMRAEEDDTSSPYMIVQDASPAQIADSLGELLVAGTRDKLVMMEWTSHQGVGLPEGQWPALLQIGLAALQPLLDTMEQFQQSVVESKQDVLTESDVRASLGLEPLAQDETDATQSEDTTVSQQIWSDDDVEEQLLLNAMQYCAAPLKDPLKRLFGVTVEQPPSICRQQDTAIQAVDNLLSKSVRAARETAMQQEVQRLVDDFIADSRRNLAPEHQTLLCDKVADRLFKRALWEAVSKHGVRSDQRGAEGAGWRTIRPIYLQAPALPDTVHGSALFARGQTQVLCTVTLGPPSEGLVRMNPYAPASETKAATSSATAYSSLPVGSLRFLRTQEALTSDMNSKKVQAEREPTGASGNLSELKRAFLQYNFPTYSTGKVPDGGQANKRRSVGHGNLAERAILPLLPSPEQFSYAIRMTSEVTDSNGSSSMASVCGVTMALLDAGVPLTMPVSGVSVGAVVSDEDYALMLDITGTEDHYGAMDLKVAGTSEGVTALQMDVKQPLPIQTVIDALNLARSGRRSILNEMEAQFTGDVGLKPRAELKHSAPRVEVVRFNPERKRDAIGPGGIVLRQLEDRYGVSLDLTQEGRCLIFGSDREMVMKAKMVIMDLVSDVAVGDVHIGTIIEIKDIGAVVELLRNKEGLLHVSEISEDEDPGRHPQGLSGFVRQHLSINQEVQVRVIDVDPIQGSIKLSMKGL